MSFIDSIKSLINPPQSISDTRHKVETQTLSQQWDSSTQLLDLTGYGDWLTLGDCFTGIAVFGAAGSGKTSSLATVAQLLMLLDCGFVWLCAKPDEVRIARNIARSAGRQGDVIVVGEDVDGVITRHRFNPLQYEAGKPSQGSSSVMTYLSDCAKVLSRKDGERSGGEGDRFWTDQFERLLRHCIDTAKYSGRTLSIELLREIQLSAPLGNHHLADKQWLADSTCWQCIRDAEERMNQGSVPKTDFMRVLNFWTRDYATLDIKPRSSIDVMFAVLVDAFTAEEPLRYILSGNSTVTPDDVIEKGKIVILSLPTNIYHGAGRMAQFCFKYSFQRAMLARRKPTDGSVLRPTVLWVDEAHAFAHPFDSQYFREVRSNRGINVYLEQGIGGYMQAMNFHSADAVDDFLQNLATKFFFQNNSPETNRFAADAIGKVLINKNSDSFSYSLNGVNISDSTTQEERHQIITGQFGLLQRGGSKNNLLVSGFVLRPEMYHSTGTNIALCQFQQTNLTV
jgi:hypothetical protein